MGNDKLLRTDFILLRNMLAIFKRRYAKTNNEADSIQEVIEAVDRRLGVWNNLLTQKCHISTSFVLFDRRHADSNLS